ncbi:uncharacterized protein LOC129900083 [Solanum dulcamara]|uniref:uncharacterized protein LOC129900083 n=1 Tax=Solanum dulcamara TaxID=45834 RepID=UPI0024857E28|nr:uncharacterized protein LOC129900083 [Solanum dulcamara]
MWACAEKVLAKHTSSVQCSVEPFETFFSLFVCVPPYVELKWPLSLRCKRNHRPTWSEISLSLVEFMRINALAMRTLINDVELLILASTALCSDSQNTFDGTASTSCGDDFTATK